MQLTGQNSNLRLPWGGSTVDRVGRFQPLPGLAATPAHNRTRRKGTEKARPKREAASAGQSSPSGQAGAGSPVPAAHLEAEWARWGGAVCFHFPPHLPTLPTPPGPPGSPLSSAPVSMYDSPTSPIAQHVTSLLLPPSRTQTPPNLLLLLSPLVTSLKA